MATIFPYTERIWQRSAGGAEFGALASSAVTAASILIEKGRIPVDSLPILAVMALIGGLAVQAAGGATGPRRWGKKSILFWQSIGFLVFAGVAAASGLLVGTRTGAAESLYLLAPCVLGVVVGSLVTEDYLEWAAEHPASLSKLI